MMKKHEVNWTKYTEDGRRVSNADLCVLDTDTNLVNLTVYYNITEFSIGLSGQYNLFNMYTMDTLSNSKSLCGVKVEISLKEEVDNVYFRRIGSKVLISSDKVEESPLFEATQKQPMKGNKKITIFLYPSGRIKWRTK